MIREKYVAKLWGLSMKKTVITLLAAICVSHEAVGVSWVHAAQSIEKVGAGVGAGFGVAVLNNVFTVPYNVYTIANSISQKDTGNTVHKVGQAAFTTALTYAAARKQPLYFLAAYYPTQYFVNKAAYNGLHALSEGIRLGVEQAGIKDSKMDVLLALSEYAKSEECNILGSIREIGCVIVHTSYIDGKIQPKDLPKGKLFAKVISQAAQQNYKNNNMGIISGILTRGLLK